jgi:environmental stress-induced protein Ves
VLILRAASYRRMPWKNGGGETREIAVSPPRASLDTLEWRISLATVASNGPFSTFGGITRTLSVIQGSGIELKVGATPAHKLLTTSEPCTFDGEAPASASLIDGPIVDLNVMSRRGRFRHQVTRVALSGSRELTTDAETTIVFCRAGALICSGTELQPEDCAIIEGASQAIQLSAARPADVYLIELYRELTRSG